MQIEKEIITNNIREFKQVVANFFIDEIVQGFMQGLALHKLRQGAFVIGLIGDLGAGKTTFVQEVAELLGVKEVVTSPTFVVMKKYKIGIVNKSETNLNVLDVKFKTLIHIDAYRLDGVESASALRLDELLADPKNIIFIEWPGNIKEVLPENYVRIEIEHKGGEGRNIKIKKFTQLA